MDSLLDDVQGSLLVAHEGGGNATHNLLSPTWVEGTARWPDFLEDALRSQMLKYQFFNHRKTSSDSCAKLQAISHELRKTFDLSSWDEDVHDHLLQERMLNKVNRIRAQMESRGDLVRAGSGYISFVHTLGQPEGHPDPAINSLAPFEAVVSQLSPESFDQALQVLFNRVGYTGISSALSIWQQRNQEVEHNIMADSEYHEDWNADELEMTS